MTWIIFFVRDNNVGNVDVADKEAIPLAKGFRHRRIRRLETYVFRASVAL